MAGVTQVCCHGALAQIRGQAPPGITRLALRLANVNAEFGFIAQSNFVWLLTGRSQTDPRVQNKRIKTSHAAGTEVIEAMSSQRFNL